MNAEFAIIRTVLVVAVIATLAEIGIAADFAAHLSPFAAAAFSNRPVGDRCAADPLTCSEARDADFREK